MNILEIGNEFNLAQEADERGGALRNRDIREQIHGQGYL